MELILLEKIENLGDLGEKVNVKPGFGRNYLIPKGKAAPATKENIAYFEEQRAELVRKADELLAGAKQRQEAIDGKSITLQAKAGDEGKLFVSISNIDIAAAFFEQRINIEKRDIRMPEGAIRMLGEYEYSVRLHTDIDANIKVIVEAE